MKFYYVVLTFNRTGKEALPVQVDECVDIMDAVAEHIDAGDDIEKVYPMRTLAQAQEATKLVNELQEKSIKKVEEIIMETIKKDNVLRFNGHEVTVPEKHLEFVKT